MITILLIGHLTLVDVTKNEYSILEFYAGEKRLAKLGAALGEKTAAMDVLYDKMGDNINTNNCMDMNTSGGFTFLTDATLGKMFL